MSIKTCEHMHPKIAYESEDCPLCKSREKVSELLNEKFTLEDENKRLKEELNEITGKIPEEDREEFWRG